MKYKIGIIGAGTIIQEYLRVLMDIKNLEIERADNYQYPNVESCLPSYEVDMFAIFVCMHDKYFLFKGTGHFINLSEIISIYKIKI